MRFSDIPDLETLKHALTNAKKIGHIAHAQLFHGCKGSAALAMVLAYAQFLNCENVMEDDSCGTCISCYKISKLIHPDVHVLFPVAISAEMKKAEKKQEVYQIWRRFVEENPFADEQDWINCHASRNAQLTISIEEARAFVSPLYYKTSEGRFKIAIIWLAEYLNNSSANMLLKILEEPPNNTIFLITSNDYEKILPTILSRLQIIYIPNINDDSILNFLRKKFPDKEISVLQNAVYLSEGSLGNAIKQLSDAEVGIFSFFLDWMRKCYMQDFNSILKLSEKFLTMGREKQKHILSSGLKLFRDVMLYKTGTNLAKVNPEIKNSFEKFANAINEANLEPIYQNLNEAIFHIERNANAQICFFNTSLALSKLIKKEQ
jgi:DNA polymerase-3 subunit delta'